MLRIAVVTPMLPVPFDQTRGRYIHETARALGKLGVPTAKDVASLVARVDELAAAVVKALPGAGAGTNTSQITVAEIVDELLIELLDRVERDLAHGAVVA